MSIKDFTQSLLKSVASQIFLAATYSNDNSADIVMSVDGSDEKIVFPIVPAELPKLETTQNNETFEGVNADLSVIGTIGLRKIAWEGLLPAYRNKYSFCKIHGSSADEVINFIKRYQDEYVPMRIAIVFENGSVYVNMACLCNAFQYHRDNVGDWHYNIDLVEYRLVTEEGLIS